MLDILFVSMLMKSINDFVSLERNLMNKDNVLAGQSDIGCVIVTFNRLDKLKTTLEHYANQTLLPRYIIVSWKLYYGMRNDLIFFKKHFPTHYPIVLLKLFIKTLLSPLKGRSMVEFKMRFAAMKDR